VFAIDVGPAGYYGYEVMDTCRPVRDSEAGDADLSLAVVPGLFREIIRRVQEASVRCRLRRRRSGIWRCTHPFDGHGEGEHRDLMRKLVRVSANRDRSGFRAASGAGPEVPVSGVGEHQWVRRPMLSLVSTIEHGEFGRRRGSGVSRMDLAAVRSS